ncbi:MAG: DeoR family transcriptional regulator, partial [Chloroflexi bacterium]|nr:DeoR family transcriptional regulator [Chloroflexota bacterium]
MLSIRRNAELIARLRVDGRASVDVLARDLGVTQSTIRRDLRRLANDGALIATDGSATCGVDEWARDLMGRNRRGRVYRLGPQSKS